TKQHPIIYQAYQKERPIISGGQLITGWRKQNHLWVAPVTKGLYFRSLRVGNKWGVRGRYPNFDPNNPLTGGWLYSDNRGSFAANVQGIHHKSIKIDYNCYEN
ncbi:MAG: hypothetical protein QNJ70_31355, partial [Xenococcaceae cyanobacterium MO_207.B15]|nr:hypothetical protein [Xenococcaceae cyanobacterium MO_207.B15]